MPEAFKVVRFDHPKQVIKGYPLRKQAGRVVLDLPHAAQVLSAEDQSHDGTLMLWVMQSTDPATPKTKRQFLVTPEGEPFDIEEPLTMSGPLPLVQSVGMWVDRTVDNRGDVVAVTCHVLEILEDPEV